MSDSQNKCFCCKFNVCYDSLRSTNKDVLAIGALWCSPASAGHHHYRNVKEPWTQHPWGLGTRALPFICFLISPYHWRSFPTLLPASMSPSSWVDQWDIMVLLNKGSCQQWIQKCYHKAISSQGYPSLRRLLESSCYHIYFRGLVVLTDWLSDPNGLRVSRLMSRLVNK